MSSSIIYRIMKRLDDNSLVSPFIIPPFSQVSITNNTQKIIPYGFAFNHLEKAIRLLNDSPKLEIWSIKYSDMIYIKYELHPYRMIKLASEYADIIGECFFKNDFERIPIKIGKSIRQPGTVFCKNIELIEKINQNY